MEKSSQHFGLDLCGTGVFSWPLSYTAYAPEVLLWWHQLLCLQYSIIHFCWGTKTCSELSSWAFFLNCLITHPCAHPMEIVTDFIFLGSKSIEDGDCSHEIKRCLLLGRKAMANLDCILKSRDITLPTNVHLIKAMVFPVVKYSCESWTIKEAECWRTDTFELWYWRRLLKVPWTARSPNQSILKEISPEYSMEGLMLKLQYFGHLRWRADSSEKTLMLGKIEGRKRRGWQKMKCLDGITNSMDMSLSKLHGLGGLVYFSQWGCKKLDTTEKLNWTECSFIILVLLYQSQGPSFCWLFIFPFLLAMLSFCFPWYCEYMPLGSWPPPQNVDSLFYSMKIPCLVC